MDMKELVSLIPKGMTGEQATEIFSGLVGLAKDASRHEEEIRKIDAMENAMITEITRKYDLYHKLLAHTFAERAAVIKKHFEAIDKGIKDNDRDLILGGLQSLASFVKESPFANIEQFSVAFRSGTLPPI